MLIEIHMIQNYSPSNLNRDDLGAPKTCLFGGVTRARISSQAIKRSIRRSDEFKQALEQGGAVRTRRLISILAERTSGSPPDPAVVKLVTDAFAKGGVKTSPTADDANATNVLMFVPERTLDQMAKDVVEARKNKDKPDVLCTRLAQSLGEKAVAPDIALSGRMTELDSDGLFKSIDFHVEAALSAAHAISTHEVISEVDYFTAVDDCAIGTGTAFLDEAQYASACFYKYFCIDWHQLVENLGGDTLSAEVTLKHFMYAAALATPSGKQKSFASFHYPEGILVEVKSERRVPINYANAFAEPVPPKSQRGLVGESIFRLGQHAHDLAQGYGIKAKRFWFSPSDRHPLTYIDSNAGDPAKEKAVVEGADNVGTLDQLVEKALREVRDHLPSSSRTLGGVR